MKEIYEKIDYASKAIDGVTTSTEEIFTPMRDSLFKRFPISAPILVTFGVAATFFGIERIIAEITWLNEHPLFILLLGIMALIVSGKLYQKLG